MARRPAGHQSDPSIRDAIIAKRRHIADGRPSGSGLHELVASAERGDPILQSTALLGSALAYAGHPLWREFTLDADRADERVWLLDEHDVLSEVHQ